MVRQGLRKEAERPRAARFRGESSSRLALLPYEVRRYVILPMLVEKQQRNLDLRLDKAKKLGEAMKLARVEFPKVPAPSDGYDIVPGFCCISCVYSKCERATNYSQGARVPLVDALYNTVPHFRVLREARKRLANAVTKYRRILLLPKLK